MKILLPPTAIHHKLRLDPMPQPSRLEKTPLGLTPCQPLQIYSKPGEIGHSPCTIIHCASRKRTEAHPRVAAIPCAMVLPKPQNNRSTEKKCTSGLHCCICRKEEEEGTEDWNGDKPKNQQRNHDHYSQNPQHPQTYDVPD